MRLILRRIFGAAFLASGALGIVPTNLNAAVITDGCAQVGQSCTLEELVTGGSITIDDKLFDEWFVLDFSTLPIDISGIDVSPLDDDPLNPGVQFNGNGQFSTVGFDLVDVLLGFTVSTLDGVARIKDNSLEINDYSFGVGNVGAFINIFEDVFDSSGNLIGEKFVVADNLPPPVLDLFDAADFAPVPQISVEKTILLGGDDPADTVNLGAFTQRFSQVLEPESWALIALGLLGVGLTRRHKRRP